MHKNVETSSGDIFNLNSEKITKQLQEIVEKTIDKWKSDIKILVEESDFMNHSSFVLIQRKQSAWMGKQA